MPWPASPRFQAKSGLLNGFRELESILEGQGKPVLFCLSIWTRAPDRWGPALELCIEHDGMSVVLHRPPD